MSKKTFLIGYYTKEDQDIARISEITAKIDHLDISIKKLAFNDIHPDENELSNILIYFTSYEAARDYVCAKTLIQLQKNHPVVFILDKNNAEQNQFVLKHNYDLWIYAEFLTVSSFEDLLLKAESRHGVKSQLHYLHKKFHESEKRFLNLIRSKIDPTIVLSQNGQIRFINPACEQLFGITQDKFLGDKFPLKVSPGLIQEIDLKEITGKPVVVEMQVGELIWEDELCLTINLRDATSKKRIENELLTLRRVIHLSPLPIIITDKKAKILYVNKQFTDSSGYKPEEVIGKTPGIFRSGKHDEYFYKDLWDTILSGETWIGTICNKIKTGELYWEKQLISPVKNANGEIIYFISIRVDDVEKKKREVEKQKAETLKRVQELAGGIAHEFSQPLQVLSISMALMEREFGKSEYFDKSKKMIGRIIKLVDNLKSITTIRQQDYLSTKILDLKASSDRQKEVSKEKHILIIDDEPELLDSLIDILKMAGYSCDGISNGAGALELISQKKYDIIICDVDMPKMPGWELFEKLKDTNYDGYFVFMTGYEISPRIENIIKKADAFLQKPFQLVDLKKVVDNIFQKDKILLH